MLAKTQRGGAGGETLNGTPGKDRLAGAGGNDLIRGRGGNDSLRGGRGDDILIGGRGRDLLQGGSGRDGFNMRRGVQLAAPGSDVIRARDRGLDEINCGSGKDVAYVDRTEDGVFDCERVIARK